jgi:hypothetical protein
MSLKHQVAVLVEFRKQITCPSHEMMLSYARRSLSPHDRQTMRLHLAKCDFCGSELHLLTRHPDVAEPMVTCRIPLAMLLLAEASLPQNHLLRKSQKRQAA